MAVPAAPLPTVMILRRLRCALPLCALLAPSLHGQPPGLPAGWTSLADHAGDLQAAVRSLPPEGGTIVVPAGRWPQPAAVRVASSDVAIVGAGQRASHLVWPPTSDGIVLETTQTALRRFALRDVFLDGSGGTGTALRLAGSPSAGVTEARIARARFVQWERGLHATHAWRVTVRENTFTTCRTAAIVLGEATNVVHLADNVIGLSAVGILVHGPSHALRIATNDVEHCTDHAIAIERGQAVTIENNYVESIGPRARSLIVLGTGAEAPASCTVSGNYLNAYHAHGHTECGIHVRGGRGHALSANTVRNASRSGVRIEAGVKDYGHLPGAYDGNARDEEILSSDGLSYQANGTLAAPTIVPQGGARARDMGSAANPFRDVHSARMRLADPITGTEAWIQIGVGPPAFPAPPGSLYLDTQRATKTRLWVNVSDRNPGTNWRKLE